VAVVDRALLARIIRLIQERYGSQGKAAAALGISREHFNRLFRGNSGKALTQVLFDRLRKLLGRLPAGQSGKYGPEHAKSDAFHAILTPETKDVSDDYLSWMHERLFAIGQRAPHPATIGTPLESSGSFDDDRLQVAERVLGGGRFIKGFVSPTRKACSEILEALRNHASYGGHFNEFETRAKSRGHSRARILVAFARVVEPLAATVATAGVERSWQELDQANELKTYLKAALAREEILLRRPPDYWKRIQDVARNA